MYIFLSIQLSWLINNVWIFAEEQEPPEKKQKKGLFEALEANIANIGKKQTKVKEKPKIVAAYNPTKQMNGWKILNEQTGRYRWTYEKPKNWCPIQRRVIVKVQ